MRPASVTNSPFCTSSVPVLVFVNAPLNAIGPPPAPLARTVPLLVSVPAVRLNVVAPKLLALCAKSISPALVSPFATVSAAPCEPFTNWIVPVPVFVSAPLIAEPVPSGIVSVPLLVRLNGTVALERVNVRWLVSKPVPAIVAPLIVAAGPAASVRFPFSTPDVKVAVPDTVTTPLPLSAPPFSTKSDVLVAPPAVSAPPDSVSVPPIDEALDRPRPPADIVRCSALVTLRAT